MDATETLAGIEQLQAILESLRSRGHAVPARALLEPLAPTLDVWLRSDPARTSYLSPATGGVLVSLRIEGDQLGPVRVEVEPVWDADDPRGVYLMVAELAERSAQPEAAATLQRALNGGPWGAPGSGWGPFVGVGAAADGLPSVRCWSPLTNHPGPTALWNVNGETGPRAQPPVERHELYMVGLQMAGGRELKISAYARGIAALGTTPLSPAAQPQIAHLIGQARRADPDSFLGAAFRRAPGDGWQPVIEIGVARCLPEVTARWIGSVVGLAVALEVERLLELGLHPVMLTMGSPTRGSRFVGIYFSLRAPGPPRALPIIRAQTPDVVNQADQPGAWAQSIIDADGSVRTACWNGDADPLRW